MALLCGAAASLLVASTGAIRSSIEVRYDGTAPPRAQTRAPFVCRDCSFEEAGTLLPSQSMLRGGFTRRGAFALAIAACASPAAGLAAQKLTFEELPRGLKYADITVGEGEEVGPESRVTFHVIGRLVGKQGWVFEDSQKEDEPYRLTTGRGEMIEGLELGLQGMRVGGARRLIIPSTLGYQDRAHEPLPREFGFRQRLFGTVLNNNRRQQEASGLGEGQDVAGIVLLDVKLLNVRPPLSTS
jgi:hypothetical protein